jgi:hypothetical protein
MPRHCGATAVALATASAGPVDGREMSMRPGGNGDDVVHRDAKARRPLSDDDPRKTKWTAEGVLLTQGKPQVRDTRGLRTGSPSPSDDLLWNGRCFPAASPRKAPVADHRLGHQIV